MKRMGANMHNMGSSSMLADPAYQSGKLGKETSFRKINTTRDISTGLLSMAEFFDRLKMGHFWLNGAHSAESVLLLFWLHFLGLMG